MIESAPDIEELRSRIDSVVFDMDGVLLDISESIRPAACLAVPLYFRAVLGLPAEDSLVTSQDIELFKFAGGFNDDGDLIQAVVLYHLVQRARYPDSPLGDLNRHSPTLFEFAMDVKKRGGWLKNAEAACLALVNEPMRSQVLSGYRNRGILQCFEELLSGPYCERLYGYEPQIYSGRGYFEYDRPLLDLSLLPPDKTIAVQTGRTYAEAHLGLEFAGMDATVDDTRMVTERDGFHKPEPGGLILLAERLNISLGVYVGDTMDDLRTVRNYNESDHARQTSSRFLIALVLTGPLGAVNEIAFRGAEPDILAGDVNAVMRWLTSDSPCPSNAG